MELFDIFPIAEINERFSDRLELRVLVKDDIEEITERDPGSMHGLGMNVWNRIVTRDLFRVDPQALAKYVQQRDPRIHRRISNKIGRKVVRDLVYVHAEIERDGTPFTVAQFIAAEVFPNDLQLVDVLLQDPDREIPPTERKYVLRTHRGLGLLPAIIARAEEYAAARNLDFITLTASQLDLVPLFESFGFAVEDNPTARFILDHVQHGIPMEKRLK
jgi:GNAT superfamily N-acetyltransferase